MEMKQTTPQIGRRNRAAAGKEEEKKGLLVENRLLDGPGGNKAS
jgi:hypothetical protein